MSKPRSASVARWQEGTEQLGHVRNVCDVAWSAVKSKRDANSAHHRKGIEMFMGTREELRRFYGMVAQY